MSGFLLVMPDCRGGANYCIEYDADPRRHKFSKEYDQRAIITRVPLPVEFSGSINEAKDLFMKAGGQALINAYYEKYR